MFLVRSIFCFPTLIPICARWLHQTYNLSAKSSERGLFLFSCVRIAPSPSMPVLMPFSRYVLLLLPFLLAHIPPFSSSLCTLRLLFCHQPCLPGKMASPLPATTFPFTVFPFLCCFLSSLRR